MPIRTPCRHFMTRAAVSADRRHSLGLSVLEVEMQKAKARGINTATIVEDYARLQMASSRKKPADMVVTTHICRGNFRSTWVSSGGYEPIASGCSATLSSTDFFSNTIRTAPAVFRASSLFSPRWVANRRAWTDYFQVPEPSKARTPLNAVSRGYEICRYRQCALSPQCGFASTRKETNSPSMPIWGKMRMIVELADEIWDDDSLRPQTNKKISRGNR